MPPLRCKKLRRWPPYRKQQAPDPVDLAIDATEHNTAAPTPEIAIPGAATIASEAPESRRQAFLPGSDSGECRNEELLLFYYRTIAACDRLRIEGGLSRALTSADGLLLVIWSRVLEKRHEQHHHNSEQRNTNALIGIPTQPSIKGDILGTLSAHNCAWLCDYAASNFPKQVASTQEAESQLHGTLVTSLNMQNQRQLQLASRHHQLPWTG